MALSEMIVIFEADAAMSCKCCGRIILSRDEEEASSSSMVIAPSARLLLLATIGFGRKLVGDDEHLRGGIAANELFSFFNQQSTQKGTALPSF